MRGRKRDPVVGPDHLREPELLEGALEHGERECLLRREQRFAREQVTNGEVGDRQRIVVLATAEQELSFVVRAPRDIGLDEP
jgi:hypothetical protein